MSVTQRERAAGAAAVGNFVGRKPELDKIVTLLLGSVPLVTLIGPGGIGKTRLAAEAVRRYHKTRHVSVHWVRLARLAKGSDVMAVEEEMAQSVVDKDYSGRSAWATLVDTLTETDAVGRAVQSVLVVDNCEHVLDSAGDVIARLLEAVPRLSILATSREAIKWVDEQLIEVPPLSRQQALNLFRERSELTGHPVVDPDQIAMAGKICRHIHHHPLYVRLAAARLVRQPLAVLLHELSGAEDDDRRMRWSHGPRAGADPRHRGVVDVIAWSYDLCRDKERLLLDRMSVFAAGYDANPEDDDGDSAVDVGADLEAIEVVCCDDPKDDHKTIPADDADVGVVLARAEIENLLERLIDQSLVSVRITSTTTRYFLLESLRLFAAQRLRERSTAEIDEPARLAERHHRYYRDKIVYAAANWVGPAEQDYLDWARAAWDNTLTAIEGSITTPGEATLGLEICVGLMALRLPFFRGSFRETRRWTERALAATRSLDPQPTELQIQAMAWTVFIALSQGLPDDAERLLEECLRASLPDLDDRPNRRQLADTDIGLPAYVELALGLVLLVEHGDVGAITVLTRARDKLLRAGDLGAAVTTETFAAMAAGMLGTSQEAHELAARCLDDAGASGPSLAKTWADLALAITLTNHGDPGEAMDVGRTALAHQLRTRDQWSALWTLQFRIWSLARIITDSIEAGSADRDGLVALATEAAQLAGGASTLRARVGVDIHSGPFAMKSAEALAIARGVIGPEAFAAAETQGALLRPELDEVQRFAMGTLSIDKRSGDRLVGVGARSVWRQLTGAEQEVATLAAARWTNSAIATRRENSVRTVDAHMASIMQKLMITSRDDIIRFVPEDRMDQVRKEATRRPSRRNQQQPRRQR
ncbi:AAA family ATPase [Nocardia sp. NPDC049190]|uniref:helix-turn-helix transcriptional regulator n=1 Tax=Nocardia sp. NPDC049190 TaxID=3155650 RepID=UPI0033DD3E69